MRELARIDRLLNLIRMIWIKQPDLRLMQLLGNVLPNGDNYYKDDDMLENSLLLGYKEELNDKNKKQATRKNIQPKNNKKCKCTRI